MKPSIATDYVKDTGDPEPYLKKISEAGFSNIHWCHEWNTDHIYSKDEIKDIKKNLEKYDLKVTDLHASDGEKVSNYWLSTDKDEQLKGEKLIQNRIDMAAQLGCGVVVLHIPDEKEGDENPKLDSWIVPLRKTLAKLEKSARKQGIRIALENGHLGLIKDILKGTDPEYLGLCYDSGHGNKRTNQLDILESDGLKDRILCLHLNDNDGVGDLHTIPFQGTADWKRITKIISESSYSGPVTMEIGMKNSGIEDEKEFLNKAFKTGKQLSGMINDATKERLTEKAKEYRNKNNDPVKIEVINRLKKTR